MAELFRRGKTDAENLVSAGKTADDAVFPPTAGQQGLQTTAAVGYHPNPLLFRPTNESEVDGTGEANSAAASSRLRPWLEKQPSTGGGVWQPRSSSVLPSSSVFSTASTPSAPAGAGSVYSPPPPPPVSAEQPPAAVKSQATIKLSTAAPPADTQQPVTPRTIRKKIQGTAAEGRISPTEVSSTTVSEAASSPSQETLPSLPTMDFRRESDDLDQPAVRRLPTLENPIVTLLHSSKEKSSTGVTSAGERINSPGSQQSENHKFVGVEVENEEEEEGDSTEIPRVPKKDDTTYKEWYRKVFSALHKQGKEDYTVYDAIASDKTDAIPDRPSSTTPTVSKTYVKSAVSKKLEPPNNKPQHSTANQTKQQQISTKSIKRPQTSNGLDSEDELQKTFQNIELDIKTLGTAEKHAVKNHQISAVKNQVSPAAFRKQRSLHEPCQIVKPEDSSLHTGDYWLQFAEQLERERRSQNFLIQEVSAEPQHDKASTVGSSKTLPVTKQDVRQVKNMSQRFEPGAPLQKASGKTLAAGKPSNASGRSAPTNITVSSVVKTPIGKARAIFPFSSKNSKELAFNKGDVITLLQQVDSNWYEGQLKQRKGLVPANYVEVLSERDETAIAVTGKPADLNIQALVLHNFTASSPHELSLTKGAVVTLLQRVDGNWFEGRLEDGRRGLLPSSYVEELPGASHQPARLTSPVLPSDFELDLDWLATSPRSTSVERQPFSPSIVSSGARTARHNSLPTASTTSVLPRPSFQQRRLEGGGLVVDISSPLFSTSASNYDTQLNTTTPGSSSDGASYGGGSGGAGQVQLRQDRQRLDSLSPTQAWHQVLYNYTPRHEDELELLEGDVVTVMRRYEDGWCVGVLERTGEIGTFPGNYIL